MQQQLISTKFAYIEKSIKIFISLLANNQTFLRYLLNDNDYPLEFEYYDDNGTLISQPDYPMPYPLIENKTVLLTLFNPNIITDAKVYTFFSHLDFHSNEKSANIEHVFVMDIVIPYFSVQIGDKLRNARICDEICKCLDNQSVADIGRVFIDRGGNYIVNDVYQGTKLFIKADNRRF